MIKLPPLYSTKSEPINIPERRKTIDCLPKRPKESCYKKNNRFRTKKTKENNNILSTSDPTKKNYLEILEKMKTAFNKLNKNKYNNIDNLGEDPMSDTMSLGLANYFYKYSYSLFISVENYNDKKFNKLNNSTKNMLELKTTLQCKYGFNSFLTLVNPTKEEIYKSIDELKSFIEKTHPENDKIRLFVYFSSHGFKSNDEVYFALSDTNSDKPLSTAIPMKEIYRFVNYIPLKHQLWCIDSCYSGKLLFHERSSINIIDSLISKQSILGICSSSKDSTSIQPESGSIFIKALLDILDSEQILNAMKKNCYFTVHEFFEKVRQKTFLYAQELEAFQIPVMGSLKQGNEGSYLFP